MEILADEELLPIDLDDMIRTVCALRVGQGVELLSGVHAEGTNFAYDVFDVSGEFASSSDCAIDIFRFVCGFETQSE